MCKDKERKRFRCRTRSCGASITIFEDEEGPYYTQFPSHDHPPHDNVVEQMNHQNTLKRRAQSKASRNLQTIQVAMEARQELPSSRRLSTDLRFIRRMRHGRFVPKTAKDINIDDVSPDGLIFRSRDNEIIVFGANDLVVAATSVSLICVDGTFSRCPRTHFQLLTCHAVCPDGFSFPFVFALLPDKKSETYSTVFTEVDRKADLLCGKAVFSREELVVSCDFEKGTLKAIGSMACTIKCCHFHMNQAIWRFVHKNGMAKRYITDRQFRTRVRSLMVLPLFPRHKIKSVYKTINAMIPRDDNDLVRLYAYFGDVWVRSIPIEYWCQYDCLFRTNNVAESFHAMLARRILHAHPEFNQFLCTINGLIAESRMKLQAQRTNPKTRNNRAAIVRARLKTLVDNYFAGPPLGLPIGELLPVLFDRMHETTREEELYEDDPDDDGDGSDVPMELDD